MPNQPLPAPLRTIQPEGWPTLDVDLNFNFAYLFSQLGGAGGANGDLLKWFFGAGRKVGADTTAGRMQAPENPANAVRVPNATYYIDLREVVINEASGFLVAGDVPEVAGTYYAYLGVDDEIDEPFVIFENAPRTPDANFAYLGTVTTTGLEVESVNASRSAYIQDYYNLQQRAGTGGGGDGETVDLSSILARLEDLEKRVAAIEGNEDGGLVPVPTKSEAQQVEFQIALTYLVEAFPALGRLIQTAVDVPGSTGDREPLPDGPARRVFAGGNATRSHKNKSIR